MKNFRSSQPCISMNFCTEFRKAQIFSCVIVNAVFCDPLPPIDFEFIDHWLRHWNIFVKIDVFCSRYIRSKFLYKSLKFQIIIFFDFHQFVFPLMPHFSKQFLIVRLVISFHTFCSHRIAISTSTPLTICVADVSSWILASTFLTSLFRYLTFKFWMILG